MCSRSFPGSLRSRRMACRMRVRVSGGHVLSSSAYGLKSRWRTRRDCIVCWVCSVVFLSPQYKSVVKQRKMRFVFTLFFIIFTLMSCIEFFGGSFWIYRVINVLALTSLWIACRGAPRVVPMAEEFIELDVLDELGELVDVEDADDAEDTEDAEDAFERMKPLPSV